VGLAEEEQGVEVVGAALEAPVKTRFSAVASRAFDDSEAGAGRYALVSAY
jgi:hypothetical protein